MFSMFNTRSVKVWLAAAVFVSVGLAPLAAKLDEGQGNGKRYKATRPFVVDKQSGEVRMPTQQEVDEVVANLTTLGQRGAEGLTPAAQPNGAVTIDLEGSNSGVLLARPNGDGTWETRCVFTVEEGTAFLGIVVDDSAR